MPKLGYLIFLVIQLVIQKSLYINSALVSQFVFIVCVIFVIKNFFVKVSSNLIFINAPAKNGVPIILKFPLISKFF